MMDVKYYEEPKISIVGDVFSETGFARHTRNLTKALIKEGCSVGLETNLPQGWELMAESDILEAINTDNKKETVIMISHPHSWPLKLSEQPKRFIGFLVFEGDRIPEGWVEYCEDPRVDLIFVPSEHTKFAVRNAGVKKEIKVIPHGVDLSVFRPLQEKQSSPFQFLFVGGWAQGEHDRKNLPFLLRAFTEEFKKEENVELCVKINPVYNGPGFDFENALKELNLSEDRPNIRLMTGMLSDDQLRLIYNDCDVFVCPSKAEGFGMVFLEAMACKKPVISGGYGGQTDFVNNDNGWLLKTFKLVPSKDRTIELYEGTNWAEYDVNELRGLLRHCFNNKEECKVKGNNALNEAVSRSWNSTARKVMKWLK